MTLRRLATRCAALVVTAMLAGLTLPAFAGAITIDQSSVQPNGFAGQDTYGGAPTRLTWKAATSVREGALKKLTLELPEGTRIENGQITVVTLKGLTRAAVDVKSTIDGRAIKLAFEPPVDPPTIVRVEVQGVVLPAQGATFQITGTAETTTGVLPLPAAKSSLVAIPMTTPMRIITWLDGQAWVKAWNSSLFLTTFFKPQLVVASVFLEATGWLVSMLLVAIGFPLAIPFGLALAFAKMAKLAPLRWVASLYVNVIRGTPLFLQIYIAFFGLPLIGVHANEYVLGVIVLAMNSSAYLTEIFRAGIQSIARGQFEAASSLGMTYPQAMRFVIIPQTVKRVLPTMTSEFILLYKDTAMLSAVGVFELMMYSRNLTAITGNVTPYVVAALFYLVVTTPLISYVRNLEAKLAIAEGGAAVADEKPKRRWPWQPAMAGPVTALEASSAEHESR